MLQSNSKPNWVEKAVECTLHRLSKYRLLFVTSVLFLDNDSDIALKYKSNVLIAIIGNWRTCSILRMKLISHADSSDYVRTAQSKLSLHLCFLIIIHLFFSTTSHILDSYCFNQHFSSFIHSFLPITIQYWKQYHFPIFHSQLSSHLTPSISVPFVYLCMRTNINNEIKTFLHHQQNDTKHIETIYLHFESLLLSIVVSSGSYLYHTGTGNKLSFDIAIISLPAFCASDTMLSV